MRLLSISALSLALAATALAADKPKLKIPGGYIQPKGQAVPAAPVLPPKPAPNAGDKPVEKPVENIQVKQEETKPVNPDGTTVFNGKTVPPLTELTPDNFDGTVNDGYWMVKHYSPYCHHCLSIAGLWQTLYEFYYTSDPLSQDSAASSGLNSFTRYYNFHFANVNCAAFGDLCEKNGATAYPTFSLYKNGKEVKKFAGTRSMQDLSDAIEEVLEAAKPGSRPKGGVKLPKEGAHSVSAGTPDVKVDKSKNTAAGTAAGEKHNKEHSLPPPSTLIGKHNVLGESRRLTAENFQDLVTTTQDPWFIKFYAPWCGHCQAMAGSWSQLGREMKGLLNIGEVNCEAEHRLCKDIGVQAYPTIIYFHAGERVEYEGLRGLGDLKHFADKAVDAEQGIQNVDAASFKDLEAKEEVIFIYFYDHATTSEDFAALERLRISLIGHAKLVKTSSKQLAERYKIRTWPRILVSRDGRPTVYDVLAPKEMRDYRKILNWMKTVWLPLVPELTATNSREIMDNHLVVLGILDRNKEEDFQSAKRELKEAAVEWADKNLVKVQTERQELRDAKNVRIKEAEDKGDQRALRAAKGIRISADNSGKEVRFAWVDGVFWDRWIRTTYGVDVKGGDRVVINDEDRRKYYDTTISGDFIRISRSAILDTLRNIIKNQNKIKPKSTISGLELFFFRVKSTVRDHPIWSAISGIIVILVGGLLYRSRIRKGHFLPVWASGGHLKLDGKERFLGNGGNSDEKVD